MASPIPTRSVAIRKPLTLAHGPFTVAPVLRLGDCRATGAVVQAAFRPAELPRLAAGVQPVREDNGRRALSGSAGQPLSRRQTGPSWQGLTRWLVLDIAMPAIFRPVRPLITRSFDKENVRTMAALKTYAGANPAGDRGGA